jgi:hypothetical protein
MNQITAGEFIEMFAKNASVFEHWDTPLEIIGYVYCDNSRITHLSKHLTFLGNEKGEAASFSRCSDLKIATGTFHGFVSFAASGIEKIKNLKVTQTNLDNCSASFYACKSLQIATGNYDGFVSFWQSGVHTIKDLHIENSRINGDYTDFYECPNLHSLEGLNLTKKHNIEPEKLLAENKRRNALKKFVKKNQAEELPFL